MRTILSVHNAYLSRGGEDSVFESEAHLLEMYGHSVTRFKVDADELAQPSVRKRAELAIGTIWSSRYFRRFEELLQTHRPDIVHFHNIFPLISPAAYVACRRAGIPTVQTLHNYRLICPNVLCFRDGHPCEDCVGRKVPWSSVRHGCYHDSRLQTAVIATMLTTHRLRGTWRNDIDVYIALTDFSRTRFIAGGLPPQRIEVKPNFVEHDPGLKEDAGDRFLFVGRLSDTKGVDILLRAWTNHRIAAPLYIAGDGPAASLVEQMAEENPHIHYLGRVDRQGVIEQMRRARAVIFPSVVYENFPVTIAEAFACGVPVIGSRRGAMAEIIDEGRTGLLFTPGDADDLAAKANWAWNHPLEMSDCGAEARQTYEEKYTASQNYKELMRIYALASERAHAA